MISLEISAQRDSFHIPLGVGVRKDRELGTRQVVTNIEDDDFSRSISHALETVQASEKIGDISVIPSPVDSSYPLLATGVGKNLDTKDLRHSVGAVARAASSSKDEELLIAFPHRSVAELQAILEGALLGVYKFTKYRSEESTRLQKIIVLSQFADTTLAQAALKKAQLIARAVYQLRDLVNTPARDLNPQDLAAIAEEEAISNGCQVQIFAGADLEKENLAGLLAVGSGSATPPRLVRVEWNPPQATYSIALVGKGITFDSGGYSLKPPTSMVTMKTDMTGAATVLETVLLAAQLELPIRVTAWLCLAENMVSATSTRPDDVITYRNGKSVEINNTDAEGRLVLADGLLMACAEKPDEVIDIATLTGAAIVALGNRLSGVMGNPELRKAVRKAAEEAGEDAWEMPLPTHLRQSLSSDIADMKNTGKRPGGMLVAGLFLQEFVDDVPWAHIDIAGPAFNTEKAYGYIPQGGTGVMLRTLLQHVENRCA